MKIILTENQHKLLVEVVSSVLYHKTTTSNLLNILETNEFHLTSIINNESDKLHKEFFFLSTARNKNSDFFNIVGQGIVFLELDGELLNRKYRGKAVNYFNYSIVPPKENASSYERQQYVKLLASQEMEDRIISDKNIIPNAISYIKEVSIFVDEHKITDRWSSSVRKIALLLKKNNIPLYFYDDEKAMKIKNKKKTINLKNVLNKLNKRAIGRVGSHNNYYALRALYYMVEAYYNNGTLSEKTRKWINALLNAAKNEDSLNKFKKNAHLDFHLVSNYPNRFFLRLLKIFRKEKIDNIKDFLDILIKKWKTILEK